MATEKSVRVKQPQLIDQTLGPEFHASWHTGLQGIAYILVKSGPLFGIRSWSTYL